jgi:histidinol-phosphatase
MEAWGADAAGDHASMTDAPDLDADLALARSLAAAADETALTEHAAGVRTQTKADGTPVTNVDLAVDRVLVDGLRAARPDDAVLSEESGRHGASGRRWILDPIDGTFNLVAGHAHWGTQVALEVDGVVVVGVITRPLLGAHWWAVLGGGAFTDDGHGPARLRVSSRAEVAGARLRLWSRDADHEARIRAVTAWTDADMNDVLGVAEGRCDAVIGCPGEIWDHAPNVLLVEEAGGSFRDQHGGHRIDSGRATYSNGVIDAALARLLAG